jgi:hypothetical protein
LRTPSNPSELKNKFENLQPFSEDQLALINEKITAFFLGVIQRTLQGRGLIGLGRSLIELVLAVFDLGKAA